MTIGEAIRKARKKKGLTQQQLGDLCMMPDSQIRLYESDRGTPKFDTLKRIADALDVGIYGLLMDVASGADDVLSSGEREDLEIARIKDISSLLPTELYHGLLDAIGSTFTYLANIEDKSYMRELEEIMDIYSSVIRYGLALQDLKDKEDDSYQACLLNFLCNYDLLMDHLHELKEAFLH